MIDFTTAQPLPEAVASLGQKTPLGSKLGSAEWASMPAEVRMRAFFAARMENERILAEMQRRILQRVKLEKDKRADGTEGAHMDRGRFIEEMRMELKKAGYKRGEDVKKGSLQDFASERRLGLIWDMQLAQAHGYARWKSDMTPEGLENEPAYELIRTKRSTVERDWPRIWRENGGKFYGDPGPDYPDAPGRMMAVKTSGIWVAISQFGTPWPPFRWGSGMGLTGIDIDEAEDVGLVGLDDAPQTPLEAPFNTGVQASLKFIPEPRRQAIDDDLAGEVEIEGDVIKLKPLETLEAGFEVPPMPSGLTDVEARAREIVADAPAEKLAELTKRMERTAAYQNLKNQSGEGFDEEEAAVRAVTQMLSDGAGLSGHVLAARRGPVRDAFWTAMDFLTLGGWLATWIGGAQ